MKHTASLAATLLLGGCAVDPQLQRATAPIPGGWLCFERATPDRYKAGIPIVLVSGGQLGMGQWDRVFDDLSRHMDVVRYDPRGFGTSAPTGAAFRHERDLEALLDHLDMPVVHLVGFSLGGRIAVDFARTWPDRVAAMTLLAPGLSGWSWSEAHDASFAAINAAVTRGDGLEAARRWLQHDYVAPTMANPTLAPMVRRLAEDNRALWVRRRSEAPVEGLSAYEELPRHPLDASGSILVGAQDVPDIHGIAAFLDASCPNLTQLPLEECGHLLPIARPESVVRTIRADHVW